MILYVLLAFFSVAAVICSVLMIALINYEIRKMRGEEDPPTKDEWRQM